MNCRCFIADICVISFLHRFPSPSTFSANFAGDKSYTFILWTLPMLRVKRPLSLSTSKTDKIKFIKTPINFMTYNNVYQNNNKVISQRIIWYIPNIRKSLHMEIVLNFMNFLWGFITFFPLHRIMILIRNRSNKKTFWLRFVFPQHVLSWKFPKNRKPQSNWAYLLYSYLIKESNFPGLDFIFFMGPIYSRFFPSNFWDCLLMDRVIGWLLFTWYYDTFQYNFLWFTKLLNHKENCFGFRKPKLFQLFFIWGIFQFMKVENKDLEIYGICWMSLLIILFLCLSVLFSQFKIWKCTFPIEFI